MNGGKVGAGSARGCVCWSWRRSSSWERKSVDELDVGYVKGSLV
jgi:hypothetical protein